jgi:hypothetical protein
MENTAKDQNKNNEIIITEKKRKETGVHCSQNTHTHTHAPQTYRKEGHST